MPATNTADKTMSTSFSRTSRVLRRLARLVVRVFYRRCEIRGLENLPKNRPVLLCANHTSAIADAIIIHATYPGVVHPMARSGLFSHPVAGPLLRLQKAVPVFRRQDMDGDTSQNARSFERCYEMFAGGATLLIFPEGQSHTDPHLHQAKTGAARLALGAKSRNGSLPDIVPVGLTFTERGRFRSAVLIQFGEPLTVPDGLSEERETDVRSLTDIIEEGMASVTLNLESWAQHDFLKRLERFLALRRARLRRTNLQRRFRTLRHFQRIESALNRQSPELLQRLKSRLEEFDQLCDRFGVKDYQLSLQYSPRLVLIFVLRSLAFVVLVLPLALWGIVNSAIPFYLTRHLSRKIARSQDQYDTAKIGLGAFFFLLFWSLQLVACYWYLGGAIASIYALSLPITAAIALTLRRERRRIHENVAAFFLFIRKRDLREDLNSRKNEIEQELAHAIRRARARGAKVSHELK